MSQRALPFIFADTTIEPGHRQCFHLPMAALYTGADVTIPIEVVHGKRSGPCLLICAAIHGDELNGVEIVRRVLHSPWLKDLRGTLIAVPVVNVLGCANRSRYLPDRRDLNRCFPGSEQGSLAARLAYLFTEKILKHANYAIDLHTGAIDRSNLPQLRAHLANPEVQKIAELFGVPVVINGDLRDGSLRGIGDDIGIPIITYEAGEALRYDENCISAGVRGIRRVMRGLDMLPKSKSQKPSTSPVYTQSTTWVRATSNGFLTTLRPLGARVEENEPLGFINGPLDNNRDMVTAPCAGIIIGRTNLPLTYEGEALFHIAQFPRPEAMDIAAETVDTFTQEIEEHIARQTDPIA